MNKKLKKYPKRGGNFPEWIEKSEFKYAEKITKILKSSKTSYGKKVALFNWLKGLDVGELQPQENQRVDSLLLSRIYNKLAKKNYAKT